MPKRARKKKDVNQIAHEMVAAIVAGKTPRTVDGKNPFAVALGRRGGLKGGRARAEKLTAPQRIAIAQRAAQARWGDAKKG